MSPRLALVVSLSLLACGVACGGASRNAAPPAAAPPPVAIPASTPPSAPMPAQPTAEATPVAPAPVAPPAPPVEEPRKKLKPPAFVLANEGESDLLFAASKGWQLVIFAYTGTPPHAKAVQLFPSVCTASCDDAEVCPVCEQPKTKKEELAKSTEKTVVAPGATLNVDWDGQVYSYEKAPGKKKCQCWRKAPPAAGDYTVKACGLRASKEAGRASKATCNESKVALPVMPGAEIKLSFPK